MDKYYGAFGGQYVSESLMNTLDELEKAGALERKRQGPGKPNKLYLKKVF